MRSKGSHRHVSRHKAAGVSASKLLPALAISCILATTSARADDWLQFGYDESHSGNNSTEAAVNLTNVSTLVLVYSVPLPSSSAAQPVYVSNVQTSSGPKNLLFASSSDGHILAIDASNGGVIWSAQPTPKLGIWGQPLYEGSSPAVDPNRLFVYHFGLDGRIHKYATGSGVEFTTSPWPVVSTLKVDVEHGTAALTFSTRNGGPDYLYAVTNGYNGDYGDYQGHLTTINLATGASRVFNTMCSNLMIHFVENGTPGVDDCADTMSGIWGRPGSTFDPSTDRVYITTGNGHYNANTGGFNWGDSVLALSGSGAGAGFGNPLDSYTPTEYAALDSQDVDLGSGALALLPAGANSKFPHLGVVTGKDSLVRLLNLDDMSGQHGPGHVGGELQLAGSWYGFDGPAPQPAVWVDKNGDQSTWVFESPHGALTAYQLTADPTGGPQLSQRWSAYTQNIFVSPFVANGVLYAGATWPSLSNFSAFDPKTGQQLWMLPNNIACCGWGSPILVDGRLYVVSDHVTSFALDSIFKNSFE